jgi:LPS-assembly lipoprotein
MLSWEGKSVRVFSSLILILSCSFLLVSCGFTPLYGEKRTEKDSSGYSPRSSFAQVEISLIPDRSGQMLRNLLIDRLYSGGYPVNPSYTLKIEKLAEAKGELDITKSAEATRAQLTIRTQMVLLDAKGVEVLRRPLSSITSYNVLQSEFATRVTEENARSNAIAEIARQAELALSLYFHASK